MEINSSTQSDDCSEIILFDSSATLQDIQSILKNQKIITFDYESHKLLLENGISHEISEDYVEEKIFKEIENFSYTLTRWYDDILISKKIMYDGLNLGSLFYMEFHRFLVQLLKKFFELQFIFNEFNKLQFIASPFMYDLFCCITTSKIDKFGKNHTFDSLHDDLKIRLTDSYTINLSKKNYLKLKSYSEKILKILTNSKKDEDKKSFLFVEFDPTKYQNFFDISKSKYNSYIFNRRRPAIYNLKSLNIINKSKIKIITSNDISNKNFEKNIENICMEWNKKLDELFTNKKFFNDFFSIESISFWNALSPFFTNLCKQRFEDAMREIEISKTVFSKNNFTAVIVWSESGFNEQIIIHQAKKSKIPIVLLQHGLYYDSDESVEFNKFYGVLPFNSDVIACWGKSFSLSLLKWGFSPDKIKIVGSPSYDDIYKIKETSIIKNKFILLATSSPTQDVVSDLSIETQEHYFNSIKNICKVIFESKQDLVIKLHPSLDEIDITNMVKENHPQAKIIKYGNIGDLIKSCEIFITIDISTTMLEAQIYRKPIISVTVKSYAFGNSSIFNACIQSNLDNFEKIFNELLIDLDLKKRLTVKGDEYLSNYICFQNSSSEKFIEMLDQI
jgi:hypothetical protein